MVCTRYLIYALSAIVTNCNCDSVMQPSFDSANSTINITSDDTTETHRTTCKITTERLVATAQATFTSVLTDACNAKTIDERFDKLESSMNTRLEEIKEIIVRGMTKGWHFSENNDDYPNKRKSAVNKDSPRVDDSEFGNRGMNCLSLQRRDEVNRYNNSVHVISTAHDQSKVYTYYWRLSDIDEKLLQWETGRSERSSTFHVGDDGYAMYLRFTPKYFPDGTIFLSVGLTTGLHDSQLIWPFPLLIRIEILDLAATNKPEDRRSRLWDPATVCSPYFWGRPGTFAAQSNNPECVGLSMPRQLLIRDLDCDVHLQDLSSDVTRHSSYNDAQWSYNAIWLKSLAVYMAHQVRCLFPGRTSNTGEFRANRSVITGYILFAHAPFTYNKPLEDSAMDKFGIGKANNEENCVM